MRVYRLPPTVLPPRDQVPSRENAGSLQRELAALGFPGFEHIRAGSPGNPAEVLLSAVSQADLDPRLVEALPWVMGRYPDLDWEWLRDHVKLRNAQNRLGYLVLLAREVISTPPGGASARPVLLRWQNDLEEARLAREGTLCRDSMPDAERRWLRTNRPAAAAHWRLLTSLTARQLPYAS
jgi:hypothetical protein